MLAEEIRATQTKIGLIAQVVITLPLEEMAQEIERADSVGAILDPTAWMNSADAMRQWKQLITPLIQFQKIARELAPIAEEGGGDEPP